MNLNATHKLLVPDTSQGASTYAIDSALVMMVDDEPINIEMTQAFLEEAGYSRFCSTSEPRQAIQMMRMMRPHVILLDIQMPEVSGFDILQAMRADPALRYIPAIVLTSALDPEIKLRALELGASDFLNKPVDASELVLRLRNTLAARAYQEYLAYFDNLTGLPNRQRCLDEIERALRSLSQEQQRGALIQIDVDRFTQINEALGPADGDTLLREIAQRLSACVKARAQGDPESMAAALFRLSGDEFMVLARGVQSVETVADFAETLRASCAPAFQIGGREIFATLSLGIALYPHDGGEVNVLMQHVGSAINHAKQAGRNTTKFYAPALDALAMQHLSVESELRRAIERDELRVFYQPKVDAATRKLVGAEALVRWQHPEKGLLGPGYFIPVAERANLIVPVGDWVLKSAHSQLRAWNDAGLPQIKVSINVSPQQFRDAGFVGRVRTALQGSPVAGKVCFELTETSMMDDPESKLGGLNELKSLGLALSIDDFGVGYSSLSYLRRMPLDELKIDKSFIDDIETSEDSAAIVVAIIGMAHTLGLSVVAEGVEKEGQVDFLHRHKCDEIQGYFFSRPLPAADFEQKWLRAQP